MGARIGDMRLGGKTIDAAKTYKVAGWAPVAEDAAKASNPTMVWEVVEQWLKARGGKVTPRQLNSPKLSGVLPNPGYAA